MNRKGFTLIELVAVIAILAILVLLAAPRYLDYTKDAKIARLNSDVKVLENAATMYNIQHDGFPVISEEEELPGDYNGFGSKLDKDKIKDYVNNIGNNLDDYVYSQDYNKIFYLPGEESRDGNIHYTIGEIDFAFNFDFEITREEILPLDGDSGNITVREYGTNEIVIPFDCVMYIELDEFGYGDYNYPNMDLYWNINGAPSLLIRSNEDYAHGVVYQRGEDPTRHSMELNRGDFLSFKTSDCIWLGDMLGFDPNDPNLVTNLKVIIHVENESYYNTFELNETFLGVFDL